MKLFGSTLLALYVLSAIACAQGTEWNVSGTILTATGILADGTLSISADGKIANVGPTDSIQATGNRVRISGIILPGFIDLHDHLTWNVQPRWLPSRKY